MEAILIVAGIVLTCFGWMWWYARHAARHDPVKGESLSRANFPGDSGSGP